jgi:hypothetical protein
MRKSIGLPQSVASSCVSHNAVMDMCTKWIVRALVEHMVLVLIVLTIAEMILRNRNSPQEPPVKENQFCFTSNY